jgi:hypothetical protein
MNRYTFGEFLNLFSESAHPELQKIIKSEPSGVSKAKLVAKKIKDLINRGEPTGVEDKMPKGSSRAFVKESEPAHIVVDGRPAQIHTGYKIAIPADLDKTHDKEKYGGTLGQLQMRVENGDHFLNNNYRVLTNKNVEGQHHFETNTDTGIFPPLMEHDHEHDSWSHVGHVGELGSKFRALTKTPSHPNGISHDQFCEALERTWNTDHGKYWHTGRENEEKLDKVEEHPLVQKFLDHQRTFLAPPHDYRQKRNMGVWTHPITGQEHIVARDHGFNSDVFKAYEESRDELKRRLIARYRKMYGK